MKILYLTTALFLFLVQCSFGQYAVGNDGPTEKWVKLGSIALPQGGNDCVIRIVGGVGYNASIGQQGHAEMFIRTSNWDSVDGNGFGFSATATTYGRSGFIGQIKVVPNSPGVSATSYSIYVYFGVFTGSTYYTVESLNGTWTTASTASSSDPGGYLVPFEHFINTDAVIAGNVGIGTGDTHGYKLAVNGDVHAKKVVIDLVNWPDYVFKPSYNLKPLSEVKSYIDLNHHLPEMPSDKEVADKGVDLGEMNKLLVKKVEELTLYLIELKRENEAIRKDQSNIRAQVKKLGTRHKK